MSLWNIHFALLGLLGVVWLGGALFTNRTVRRESIGSRFAYGLVLAAGVLLVFRTPSLVPTAIVPAGTASAAAGIAMTAVGVAFAIWARIHLGRLWSGTVTLKEGHHLVRSGPYRLARHPIYTGFFLAVLGAATHVGTLAAFLGSLVVLAGFYVKARKEEHLLSEQFGDEYAAYRREVRMLIPFVM